MILEFLSLLFILTVIFEERKSFLMVLYTNHTFSYGYGLKVILK